MQAPFTRLTFLYFQIQTLWRLSYLRLLSLQDRNQFQDQSAGAKKSKKVQLNSSLPAAVELVSNASSRECFTCDTIKELLCFRYLAAYRFQIAGYRDVHEYRDVKQKEPVSDIKSLAYLQVSQNVEFYELLGIDVSDDITTPHDGHCQYKRKPRKSS